MSWNKSYIIVRFNNESNSFEVVHQAEKIKDARYWLNYIAQPSDALFRTPKHPKYSGQEDKPEYQAHLVERGKVSYEQNEWEKIVNLKVAEIDIVSTEA